MSGYDMKRFIEEALSHFWKESYGSIYPHLKRLADEGLVDRETERGRGSPDRHVYSLTTRGRDALQEWLEEPTEDEPAIRSELLLKVFFGANLDQERLRSLLARFRDRQKSQLDRLRAAERKIRAARRGPRDSVYWLLTVRRGLLAAQARLRWAEMSLREIARLPAGARPVPRRSRRSP